MKKIPAPDGLDFVPVPGGDDPNFIFGVVRRQIKDGPVRTVPASVLKRLCPGQKVDVAHRGHRPVIAGTSFYRPMRTTSSSTRNGSAKNMRSRRATISRISL